jgi:hypothetical protein
MFQVFATWAAAVLSLSFLVMAVAALIYHLVGDQEEESGKSGLVKWWAWILLFGAVFLAFLLLAIRNVVNYGPE